MHFAFLKKRKGENKLTKLVEDFENGCLDPATPQETINQIKSLIQNVTENYENDAFNIPRTIKAQTSQNIKKDSTKNILKINTSGSDDNINDNADSSELLMKNLLLSEERLQEEDNRLKLIAEKRKQRLEEKKKIIQDQLERLQKKQQCADDLEKEKLECCEGECDKDCVENCNENCEKQCCEENNNEQRCCEGECDKDCVENCKENCEQQCCKEHNVYMNQEQVDDREQFYY